MALMAIDHVRVYSGLPPGGPSAGIFFTRWITHFCAPGFVFFAGASAFLLGRKLKNKVALAHFLLTRGILLVVLELTVIRFFWTFNLDYAHYILAGVIWMLGWCMILLAAFVWLRSGVVGIIGLAIIFFQQVFQLLPKLLPVSMQVPFGRFWEFIYTSGFDTWPHFAILYVLVPWIGVMMAGYGFGNILQMDPARRRRICLWIGLSAILVFLVVGSIIAISQQAPQPFIFRLLNQRKYPASPLFLLMTLGPIIAFIPFAEKAKGWLAEALKTIGRVPLFYYLLHILLIHTVALFVNFLREGNVHHEWYVHAPSASVPKDHKWGLLLLYLVYLFVVPLLYIGCRWYSGYKFAHSEKKWLKYI